jgi:hypothetical protein
MKDCAFQYATGDGVVLHDTGLITRVEAEVMWQDNIPTFKDHMERGREPEMAIWINMESEGDFYKKSAHWCAEDMEIRGGDLYEVTRVG